jgi:hypothetical protein
MLVHQPVSEMSGIRIAQQALVAVKSGNVEYR